MIHYHNDYDNDYLHDKLEDLYLLFYKIILYLM